MFRPRIIPVLLLKDRALVKSIRFKDHRYIGDPLNAVRTFDRLKADELIFLDIEASKRGRPISLDFVRDVGDETSMPFAVGGGISSLDDIENVIKAGAEKVVINTRAGQDPNFIREASDRFGATTIAVCIDVKKSLFSGRRTRILNGSRSTGCDPVEFARSMEDKGAGELIIQSIDRDGMMDGYDIELLKSVSTAVGIPVVALGGAGTLEHLTEAYREGHASALAAGSLFVYQSKKRGVLINYPARMRLMLDDAVERIVSP